MTDIALARAHHPEAHATDLARSAREEWAITAALYRVWCRTEPTPIYDALVRASTWTDADDEFLRRMGGGR